MAVTVTTSTANLRMFFASCPVCHQQGEFYSSLAALEFEINHNHLKAA